MDGAIYNTNLGDGRTNVRTVAVSHRVLVSEACSADPAPKVLRCIFGSVVRRLLCEYIILCESRGQQALNGSMLLLVTAYLT